MARLIRKRTCEPTSVAAKQKMQATKSAGQRRNQTEDAITWLSTLTPTPCSPELQAARRTVAAAPPPTGPEIRLRLDQPLPEAVEMLEQSMIRRALQRSHGRVEEAAWLLGISRKGLFLKRRRWGLQQHVS